MKTLCKIALIVAVAVLAGNRIVDYLCDTRAKRGHGAKLAPPREAEFRRLTVVGSTQEPVR